MEGSDVTLYVYDLSKGMAAQLSMQFLGKHLPGIWHTGIVCYGKEYFFGGGIQISRPGATYHGPPDRTISLGRTQIPEELFKEFLESLNPRFNAFNYHLLENNCNNFTNEVSLFLLGKEIPADILGLPTEFLSTPMGQMMKPMIDQLMTPPGAMQQQQQNNGFGSMMGNQFLNNQFMNNQFNYGQQQNTSQQNNLQQNTQQTQATKVTDIEMCLFDKANVVQVGSKLKEFLVEEAQANTNQQTAIVMNDSDYAVLEKWIEYLKTEVIGKQNSSVEISSDIFEFINKSLAILPEKKVYPLLDLFRVFILSNKALAHYTNTSDDLFETVLSRYLNVFKQISYPTQLMVMRVICNLFKDRAGINYVFSTEHISQILLDSVAYSFESALEGVRLTGASLAYNFCQHAILRQVNPDMFISLVSALVFAASKETSDEVLYRMLLSLKSLVVQSEDNRDLVKTLEPDLAFPQCAKISDKSKVVAQSIQKLLG